MSSSTPGSRARLIDLELEAVPDVRVLRDDPQRLPLAGPPIQIGGYGFCTGFGFAIASVEPVPVALEARSGPLSTVRFTTRQASSRRAIRCPTVPYSSPSIVCSTSAQAAPRPNSSRPPERWSTVTAIFASTPGWRYVLPVTMHPIRTRVVASAIAPSSVHASRMSPVGSSRIEAKWSKFQTVVEARLVGDVPDGAKFLYGRELGRQLEPDSNAHPWKVSIL